MIIQKPHQTKKLFDEVFLIIDEIVLLNVVQFLLSSSLSFGGYYGKK